MKPSRVTARTAFAWRKPYRPARPECHSPGLFYIVATRDGERTILTSRRTRAEAAALADLFVRGGIEAVVSVERDGGRQCDCT